MSRLSNASVRPLMQQSLPCTFRSIAILCSLLLRCSFRYVTYILNAALLEVCTPALNILDDMGVLKELVDNNEAHFADSGGFVSPSGLAYIGRRTSATTKATSCIPIALALLLFFGTDEAG